MGSKVVVLMLILIGAGLTSGCVPLAIGAGTVVVADHIVEEEKGGDGLF